MAEEQTHNEAGEQAPSTVEKQAPDVAEENAPATSEPKATDLPTANAPDPEAVSSEANPNAAKIEEKPDKKPAAKKPPKAEAADEAGDGKPAKAAKKAKGPTVEDKPFADFVQQDYLPALKEGLAKQGIPAIDLKFEKRKISIAGFTQAPECWQVIGRWNSGRQPRVFTIYFFKEDIQGQKGFSYSESAAAPSTLESFLIDERKVNLGLLVFGVLQRLNAQKWLVRN